MSVKVLILWSSISTDAHTRRLEDLLISKKCDIEKIDGAEPVNKDFRNELFAISGLRAKYPQCFINNNGSYEFVGQWEAVETLEECDSIPAEILAAHPDIKTFTNVFFKTNEEIANERRRKREEEEEIEEERAMAIYLAEEEEIRLLALELEEEAERQSTKEANEQQALNLLIERQSVKEEEIEIETLSISKQPSTDVEEINIIIEGKEEIEKEELIASNAQEELGIVTLADVEYFDEEKIIVKDIPEMNLASEEEITESTIEVAVASEKLRQDEESVNSMTAFLETQKKENNRSLEILHGEDYHRKKLIFEENEQLNETTRLTALALKQIERRDEEILIQLKKKELDLLLVEKENLEILKKKNDEEKKIRSRKRMEDKTKEDKRLEKEEEKALAAVALVRWQQEREEAKVATSLMKKIKHDADLERLVTLAMKNEMEKDEKARPVIAALEKRQQQEEIRRQESRLASRYGGKLEDRTISGKSDKENKIEDVDLLELPTTERDSNKDSDCGDDEEEDSVDPKLLSLAPLKSISISSSLPNSKISSAPFLPPSSVRISSS